jgi:hypothetical protein
LICLFRRYNHGLVLAGCELTYGRPPEVDRIGNLPEGS